jgi:hypothetical protein
MVRWGGGAGVDRHDFPFVAAASQRHKSHRAEAAEPSKYLSAYSELRAPSSSASRRCNPVPELPSPSPPPAPRVRDVPPSRPRLGSSIRKRLRLSNDSTLITATALTPASLALVDTLPPPPHHQSRNRATTAAPSPSLADPLAANSCGALDSASPG